MGFYTQVRDLNCATNKYLLKQGCIVHPADFYFTLKLLP